MAYHLPSSSWIVTVTVSEADGIIHPGEQPVKLTKNVSLSSKEISFVMLTVMLGIVEKGTIVTDPLVTVV